MVSTRKPQLSYMEKRQRVKNKKVKMARVVPLLPEDFFQVKERDHNVDMTIFC